jgi:cell division protein FtsQ
MSRARQKPRKKKSNYLGVVLVAGVCLVAGFLAMQKRDTLIASVEAMLPIKQVRIEGELANMDPQTLEQCLFPLARGNYLTVDLKALEQAASDVGWVDSVSVTRIWPDTLQVSVTEQRPVARWGDDSLLGETGEVFALPGQSADFSSLPMLYAPRGHELEVLGMLDKLNKKLQPRGTNVSSLRISDRLAWTAILSDGLEIAIGNQDPLKALDRLLVVLPGLGEQRLALLKKVDLRYPRGFAVTWRSPSVEDAVPPSEQGPSQKPASGVKKT